MAQVSDNQTNGTVAAPNGHTDGVAEITEAVSQLDLGRKVSGSGPVNFGHLHFSIPSRVWFHQPVITSSPHQFSVHQPHDFSIHSRGMDSYKLGLKAWLLIGSLPINV